MRKPRELTIERETAYKRALELRTEGKKWPEVAEALKAEGHTTEKGKAFTPNGIRVDCGRYIKRLTAKESNVEGHLEEVRALMLSDDHDASEQLDGPVSSHQAEHGEPSEDAYHEEENKVVPLHSDYAEHNADADHAERYELPPDMERAIRRIAREVSEEVMNTMRNIHTEPIEAGECPPEPITSGKSQNREYERITLTIDKNLWNEFERERKRLGVTSRGRMADILLWRALGKPRLSFQKED